MMAFRSRFTKIIPVLACALCAASAWAQEAASVPPNGGQCPTSGAPLVDVLSKPHWNGWGVDASQHRFQPSEMAQLAVDDVPRLKLKWAFGFPGAIIAFAPPTIVAGRLFVGSQGGIVYSLDADSGCKYLGVLRCRAGAFCYCHRAARGRLVDIFRRFTHQSVI